MQFLFLFELTFSVIGYLGTNTAVDLSEYLARMAIVVAHRY